MAMNKEPNAFASEIQIQNPEEIPQTSSSRPEIQYIHNRRSTLAEPICSH